ncbi:MAG: M13 family metallopeptidase [Thalassotalea sp.]|nr:M13 family metallopeptidase [Thalassotalea sp.]MDG2393641.1 M13 family metallopeptidase [Thalassotalea sp.]
MKQVLIPGLIMLGLVACTNSVDENNKTNKQATLGSGVFQENMDNSVKPGDDFNAYVNGKWMASAKIPDDKASIGIGQELSDKAQEDVKLIIDESSKGGFAKGSDEQKVGDLYNSYLNMDKRNELGMSPLKAAFTKIDAITNQTDLAIYFASSNKLGYNQPFALGQYVDLKNPKTYMIYTWQAGLGLPDKDYYFKEGEKSQSLRDKYSIHLEKMHQLAGLDKPKQSAQMIYNLEKSLATSHLEKEKTRDMVALYTKVPLDELNSIMPDFAWQSYLTEAGFNDIDGLVITQIDYMKALNEVIKNTSIDDWKTYLKWQAVSANATRLTADLDQQDFEFNIKTLYGATEQRPMWRRAVSVVNQDLGEVIGKVYVKRHFSPQAKAQMLEMVDYLLLAYEQSIKDLDWMSDETKVQALDKLSKFTPKIGYPDKWRDYSKLTIDANDYFGNRERSALVLYQQTLDKQNLPVDRSEWGMNPQTVNAYYNPPLNEIVFPAAILQPPFFDLTVEDATNYGGIGAVIGHEIGHGFDDAGSTFDGDGVLRDWWTASDKSQFKERTNALVAQYDSFAVFPDLNVNGTFTLGENIGDLGGLSIAMKAYKLSLKGKPSPTLDGFSGEQRVLIGWAQSWRKIQREEVLRQQVGTDPHSPAKFRVNGTVSNVPEFYNAFAVDTNDALYLSEGERVKIW